MCKLQLHPTRHEPNVQTIIPAPLVRCHIAKWDQVFATTCYQRCARHVQASTCHKELPKNVTQVQVHHGISCYQRVDNFQHIVSNCSVRLNSCLQRGGRCRLSYLGLRAALQGRPLAKAGCHLEA